MYADPSAEPPQLAGLDEIVLKISLGSAKNIDSFTIHPFPSVTSTL